MPTPELTKDDERDELGSRWDFLDYPEDQAWILSALDVKFAEQEALIRQLLENVREPKPSMYGSVATFDSQVKDDFSPKGLADGTRAAEKIPEAFDRACSDLGSVASVELATSSDRQVTPPKAFSKERRKSRALGTHVMSERWEPDPPMKSFVKGPLDGYMGIVVLVNLTFMIVMTQWMGSKANESLGLPSENLPFNEMTFEVAEYVFFTLYLLDVLVRIYILGKEWIYDPRQGIMYLNLFDACLVCLNIFELFLFPILVAGISQDQQSNSLRVVKLMRIVRTLRIVKALAVFRQLRLLVGTCVASIGALFWSMVLLLVLKLGFALIICQALQGFIVDTNADLDARMEMNTLYGSFLKALYTMFEVTHSGSWPAVVRPVIEKVSPWYAAFFLTYLTLVVFAVIRVVTALFIKETLASAANDADMVMEDKRRADIETNAKLEELFLAADENQDGILSPAEFLAAMNLPSVKNFLHSMDVNIRDIGPLFEILDDGDGMITVSEFCKGLQQLKGAARAIDMVVLQHENARVLKETQSCRQDVQNLTSQLRVLRSERKTVARERRFAGHVDPDAAQSIFQT